MGLKVYIKRGIRYILTGNNPPIINVNTYQKKPNSLLKDKIFVVTGGSSGIGFSIAKRLIEEEAIVIITGRNNEKLKKAYEELGKEKQVDYKILDMENIDQFDDFFEEVYKKYKHIDEIINNAGISLHEWDFLKVDKQGFEKQFYTNLRGSYFFTQSYIKKYLNRNEKSGKILFISSERGTYCDDLLYGLIKASMNSLVQALSFKYYKEGLNINAISPGVTATNMTGIDKSDNLYSKQNSQSLINIEKTEI